MNPPESEFQKLNHIMQVYLADEIGAQLSIEHVLDAAKLSCSDSESTMLFDMLVSDRKLHPKLTWVPIGTPARPGIRWVYWMDLYGRDFTRKGGYFPSESRATTITPSTNPNTQPDSHVSPRRTTLLRVANWVWGHKVVAIIVAGALTVSWQIIIMRVDKRWNGDWDTLYEAFMPADSSATPTSSE